MATRVSTEDGYEVSALTLIAYRTAGTAQTSPIQFPSSRDRTVSRIEPTRLLFPVPVSITLSAEASLALSTMTVLNRCIQKIASYVADCFRKPCKVNSVTSRFPTRTYQTEHLAHARNYSSYTSIYLTSSWFGPRWVSVPSTMKMEHTIITTADWLRLLAVLA